eukprot:TRINITY_DN11225_c0_g1_i1.p1 TRINITY_DN11225_c0_g1~~TRINITY_DN11225_c0_g1_i1.p1  ORF type:complete len:102 (-),score=9.47 TRINITY_DN11225_c0_g1_i1:120-425(-)
MYQIKLLLGAILLLHAFVSAREYRNYLRLHDHDFTGLPYDMVAECIIGCLLACWGYISYSQDFKPIKLSTNLAKLQYSSLDSSLNFINFDKRGQNIGAVME